MIRLLLIFVKLVLNEKQKSVSHEAGFFYAIKQERR
nr:MAG TPA: hypothetical protein [Caudoviricetes sp.]